MFVERGPEGRHREEWERNVRVCVLRGKERGRGVCRLRKEAREGYV